MDMENEDTRKPSPYWDNPEAYLAKRLGEDVKPLTEQEQAEFAKITEDYWISVREIGEKKLRTLANIIVSAQKMVSDYQREKEDGGGEPALDKYIKAKGLTINDVGREPVCVRYGKRFSPVEMVFSARYDAWQVDKQFVTHITTNITDAKEIENRYGDYIRNRFLETMNKVYWEGGSRRG